MSSFSLASSENILYVVSNVRFDSAPTTVSMVDASTGAVLHTEAVPVATLYDSLSSSFGPGTDVLPGVLFAGVGNNTFDGVGSNASLLAFNASSGSVLWSTPPNDANTQLVTETVVSSEQGVVFGLFKDGPGFQGGYFLMAVNMSSGRALWQTPQDSEVSFYPIDLPLALTPEGNVLTYGQFYHMAGGVVRPQLGGVFKLLSLIVYLRLRLSLRKLSVTVTSQVRPLC